MKGNKGERKKRWVRCELIKATVIEAMVEEKGRRGEERRKEKKRDKGTGREISRKAKRKRKRRTKIEERTPLPRKLRTGLGGGQDTLP